MCFAALKDGKFSQVAQVSQYFPEVHPSLISHEFRLWLSESEPQKSLQLSS